MAVPASMIAARTARHSQGLCTGAASEGSPSRASTSGDSVAGLNTARSLHAPHVYSSGVTGVSRDPRQDATGSFPQAGPADKAHLHAMFPSYSKVVNSEDSKR